uniref:Uncharacterized protein n=1 Tax=Oryzias latipes TaxID=8090 RepID=A0A3B3HEL2_ORYLA
GCRWIISGCRWIISGCRWIIPGCRWIIPGCRWIISGCRWIIPGCRWIIPGCIWIIPGCRWIISDGLFLVVILSGVLFRYQSGLLQTSLGVMVNKRLTCSGVGLRCLCVFQTRLG